MLSVELIEAAKVCSFDSEKGWPAELPHDHVAWLQTRRRGALPAELKPDFLTWCKLLDVAIKAGTIEHTTRKPRPADARRFEITPAYVQAVRRARDSGSGWDGWGSSAPLPMPARPPAPPPKHYITAPAFTALLAALGIEPSAHISAWCKAQRVADGPAVTPADHIIGPAAAVPAPLVSEAVPVASPPPAPEQAPGTSPAPVLQLVPPIVTRQERISAATPAPAHQKPPRKKRSDAEKQAMRIDRAAGLSDIAIGKKFGVSRQRIAQLIGSQKMNREGYAKPRPMNQA